MYPSGVTCHELLVRVIISNRDLRLLIFFGLADLYIS